VAVQLVLPTLAQQLHGAHADAQVLVYAFAVNVVAISVSLMSRCGGLSLRCSAGIAAGQEICAMLAGI